MVGSLAVVDMGLRHTRAVEVVDSRRMQDGHEAEEVSVRSGLENRSSRDGAGTSHDNHVVSTHEEVRDGHGSRHVHYLGERSHDA